MNLNSDQDRSEKTIKKTDLNCMIVETSSNHDSSDLSVQRAEEQKFIDLNGIDLKGLSNIFNSYATKKTYATGFFNLALIATNFTQLKQVITACSSMSDVSITNMVILSFIVISLLLQVFLVVLLVFLAKNGEFYDEEKREQLIKNNNIVTLIVFAISIINVFINVFLNV
jgi:hypothetical protein